MTDTRTPQEIARDYEDRLAAQGDVLTETRDARFDRIFGGQQEPVVSIWPGNGDSWSPPPDVLSQILEQTRRTDHDAALSTIAAIAADALAGRVADD